MTIERAMTNVSEQMRKLPSNATLTSESKKGEIYDRVI